VRYIRLLREVYIVRYIVKYIRLLCEVYVVRYIVCEVYCEVYKTSL
jgi:hypothetical protein